MSARRWLPVPAALAAALALTGCGDSTGPDQLSSPGPTTTITTTTSAPVPTFTVQQDLPLPPPQRATTTLEGTIGAGVEAGCTVLTAADGTYLLLGTVPEAARGEQVTVTGRTEAGAVTTCQQGTPFLVQDVTVR